MKRIRTYSQLTETDRSDLLGQVTSQRERVTARLASVGHVVAVVSGKGGVGKSLVSAGLAAALARSGRRVGLLDADLHGPTAARMLGVRASGLAVRDDEVEPPVAACGVRVMSSDLLLEETAPLAWREPGHERFVWRGTLVAGMLREFLADVAWGTLDVLLVDMPPGQRAARHARRARAGSRGRRGRDDSLGRVLPRRAACAGGGAHRARSAARRGREHGGLPLRELPRGRAALPGRRRRAAVARRGCAAARAHPLRSGDAVARRPGGRRGRGHGARPGGRGARGATRASGEPAGREEPRA